ncbi:MAG: DUF2461 family protein [Bacteroidia bacterium]
MYVFQKTNRLTRHIWQAYFHTGTKQNEGARFYIHIKPGNSFIGGGRYVPDASFAAKNTSGNRLQYGGV